MIIALWTPKNLNISYLVDYLFIKAVDMKKPTLSDANKAKRANEFIKNICLIGNHKLANLLAELSIKQNPKDVIKVPRRKK